MVLRLFFTTICIHIYELYTQIFSLGEETKKEKKKHVVINSICYIQHLIQILLPIEMSLLTV